MTQRRATTAEAELWHAGRMWGERAPVADVVVWRARGELDLPRLNGAITKAVASNPALASLFRLDVASGDVLAVTDNRVAPTVESSDLRLLPEREREEAAIGRLHQRLADPFDLAVEPPIRFMTVRIDDAETLIGAVWHHIARDAQSVSLLARALERFYNDPYGHVGPAVEIEAPAEPSSSDMAWWTDRLASEPPSGTRQRLTTGPDGPGTPSSRNVTADRAAIATLLERGRAAGASDFITWLALWAVALHEYWDVPFVTIGTPISRRRSQAEQEAIGYFLNPLPIRIDLGGERDLRACVRAARSSLADVLRHSSASMPDLKAIRPAAESPAAPFDAWLATEGAGGDPLALEGLECEELDLYPDIARFPLSLFLEQDPAGALVEADSSLVGDDQLDALSAIVAARIAAWASDAPSIAGDPPARPVSLTPGGGDRETPGPRLDQWFKERARQSPTGIALEYGDLAITYGELAATVEGARQELVRAGVNAGCKVALLLRRGPSAVVALLAVLAADAAYVALDPTGPDDRLRRACQKAGVDAVVTDDPARAEPLSDDGAVVTASDWPTRLAHEGEGARRAAGNRRGIAYLTFTSGSSGEPKGIVMPHEAVCNLISWQIRRYGEKADGFRVMQFAPLAFDVSAQEIFGTFAVGGTLVLVDDAARADLAALPAFIADQAVQRAYLPAPLARLVCEGLHRLGRSGLALREVISGSEQLVASAAMRALFDSEPDLRLFNEYGPSETHVCTVFEAPRDTIGWAEWMPVGQAISGAEVHLVRRDGSEDPTNGEIHIGGAGLAWGYEDDPRQTAAAFVPDAMSGRPGARVYRTGDMAERRPDGSLVYRGRRDRQVQVRGHRVELGEVEVALEEADGVAKSAVLAVAPDLPSTELIGFVTPEGSVQPIPETVLKGLRDRLPEYMVPGRLVVLEQMPFTGNGKTDYSALGAMVEQTGAAPDKGGHLRQRVRDEVATLLEVEEIADDADFFEAGGDSLQVVRLLWTVEEMSGETMPASEFMAEPTVTGVVNWINERPTGGA